MLNETVTLDLCKAWVMISVIILILNDITALFIKNVCCLFTLAMITKVKTKSTTEFLYLVNLEIWLLRSPPFIVHAMNGCYQSWCFILSTVFSILVICSSQQSCQMFILQSADAQKEKRSIHAILKQSKNTVFVIPVFTKPLHITLGVSN